MATEGHNFLNNETDFWTLNKDNLFLNLINKRLGSVLEVGCGKGTFLKRLTELGFKCDGIDFSKEALKEAKKICRNKVKFYEGDFNTFTFKKKYDCIILSGIIEHIKDDFFFMKKVRTLLNKNGEIILLTSAHPFLYSVYDKSIYHYRRYSKNQLKKLFDETGFEITYSRYWDILGWPYLLYAKFFNKVPLTSDQLTNKYLNKVLYFWFDKFEKNMKNIPGLNLIFVGRKI